jgi:RimJ/RimL family protein N-acetyltransferase
MSVSAASPAKRHWIATGIGTSEWGRRYFAADDTGGELVGLFVFTLTERTAEIGLGLRPDVTGKGLGHDDVSRH